MSENETTFKAPTLTELREQFKDAEIDVLREAYENMFGEAPMVHKDGAEPVPTTDKELIIRKLTYGLLAQSYQEAGEEMPARHATLAQKAFDQKFEKTGSRASRDNTIQAFIVKRLWGLLQEGRTMTVKDLGDEVVANFPGSTYKNDPIGRMRVDINKFNKGLFPYGVANEMVPEEGQGFVALPEAKEAEDGASEENDD